MTTLKPILLLVATVLVAAGADATLLPAADRIQWLTGPNLRRRLDEPVDVGWAGQGLREALQNVSRTQQVAIVIDRRVDPGQTLDLKRQRTPLATVLAETAASRGLGVSRFESVMYVGPPATARLLRTVAEMRRSEAAKLPQARRLEWIRLRPWHWDELATPRDLLAELSRQGDFDILQQDLIPHDLWAAADLPPLSLADRLTLVLAQFDLTFEIDAGGQSLKLTPFPGTAWLERSYPGGKQPQKLADELSARLPNVQVRVEEGKLVVRGLLEDHEQIDAGPAKPPKLPTIQEKNLDTLRVTFTVTNLPLKAVLESLSEQLGLTIQVDSGNLLGAGKSLDGLVTLKLKDASVDDTLKAALSPAGLTFRRTDKVVQVTVAP